MAEKRRKKTPCHARYNAECRWIKNKELRIARHFRLMAKRHANAIARIDSLLRAA